MFSKYIPFSRYNAPREYRFKPQFLFDASSSDGGGSGGNNNSADGNDMTSVMQAIKENRKALETKLESSAKAAQDAAVEEAKKLLEKEIEEVKANLQAITVKQDEIERKAAEQKAADDKKPKTKTLLEICQEKEDDIKKFARKETRNLVIEIEQKAAADMTTANITDLSNIGALVQPGIITIPPRKVHMRQLLRSVPIGPGLKWVFGTETGGEGTPDTVAEGAAKSQLDFDLKENSVNIETIAGYARLSRRLLDNVPGMVEFLNTRMPELLLRKEDTQVLEGDGVSPNIKGITTAGNFTAATTTGPNLVERIIDSIAQLEDDEERNASHILLRPEDYYGFFKNKAAGSGEYDLPISVTFDGGILRINGVPVFASTAMIVGKFLVGDFINGAALLLQGGIRLEFFEQDGTNVTTNKVTVRIEENAGLPVYGDNYFIYGDNDGV